MTDELIIQDQAQDEQVQDEQPVWDFSEVSYGWSRAYSRVSSEVSTKGALLMGSPLAGISSEDASRLQAARAAALEGWDDLISQRDALMVVPLVSIPRSWLVTAAPENIGWDKPEDLEWLRGNRIDDLLASLNTARMTAQKK